MKTIFLGILRVLLYPFVYCYRIIQDAPIICCDDALIGYGACTRFACSADPCPEKRKGYQGRMSPVYGDPSCVGLYTRHTR